VRERERGRERERESAREKHRERREVVGAGVTGGKGERVEQ